MNIVQGIKMALKSIVSNKLRSLLTMLGIILGVTSVIALVALGQGATKQVTEQVQGLGTNLLTVNIVGRGTTTTLNYEQAMAFSELEGVEYVSPTKSENTTVKFGTTSADVSVMGTNPDYAFVQKYEVAKGRFLTEIDLDFNQKIALLGSDTAVELFGAAEPVGETVLIKGIRFKVVGVLASKGDSSTGSNDEIVIIPLTSAERLFQSRGIRSVYVQATMIEQMDGIVVNLESELSDIFRGNTNSYRVFNQQDILDTVSSVTDTLSLALGGIASISLFVGGIGIMNIMLVSVSERTREIGIRKAIGAKRRDILIQFLIEAMVLGGLGGVLGVGIGVGSATLLSKVLDMDIVFSFDVIMLAFSFSLIVGVLFGYLPANKAAKLKPIDALRFN